MSTTVRSQGTRGFTLLELLVVMAVLGMLAGILLPSLQQVRWRSKETQCRHRLRELYLASTSYIQDFRVLPPMNNLPDDGAWQYNYLIYDGRDYDQNFGPLVQEGEVGEIEEVFCPLQTEPSHVLGTDMNQWPVRQGADTSAGYGRRYHSTGKSFSDYHHTVAVMADVIHLPLVIKRAHKNGVNAVYNDGHVRFVRDPGLFTHNDLGKPFDPLDNPIVKDIWHAMDDAK